MRSNGIHVDRYAEIGGVVHKEHIEKIKSI